MSDHPRESIAGHVAFDAQAMEACRVDGELVDPNEASFYGSGTMLRRRCRR